MALTKAKKLTTNLQTWEEVDDHLREIGELDLEIQGVEARLTRDINQLKADADEEVQPVLARRERLEREIQEFASARKDELDGKTKKLGFGNVGFRQSTKVVLRKVDEMIDTLKRMNLYHCIITKEQVNRDALRQLPDETLKAVGAKRQIKDEFWYEVDREKLA